MLTAKTKNKTNSLIAPDDDTTERPPVCTHTTNAVRHTHIRARHGGRVTTIFAAAVTAVAVTARACSPGEERLSNVPLADASGEAERGALQLRASTTD